MEDPISKDLFDILACPVCKADLKYTEDKKGLHLDWLQSKLGKTQKAYSVYKWGKVGVAQDRSNGVHIFIHNKNNSWA